MITPVTTPETIKLIAQLIVAELEITDDTIVQIYNQKRKLPAEKGYIITVTPLGERPFGVSNRHAALLDDDVDLTQTTSINQQEIIQVDIFSYDDSARLHRIDLLFALTGDRAQQLAEKYAFKLASIPSSFVDVSEVEASKRLNRYAITFNVLRAYSRSTPVQTYTEFSNPPEVITNQ